MVKIVNLPPNDRRKLSGKNINAATTIGIIIDNITINGI